MNSNDSQVSAPALGSARHPRVALPALLAVSFLLLLVSAVCLRLWGPYTGDSPRYLLLAHNLSTGHGFSAATSEPFYPESFRAPLYPLFLATVFSLHGGVGAAIALQLVFHLAAIALAVRLAARLGLPAGAQLLLALLLSAHPGLVRWTTSITTEPLCIILFCAFAVSIAVVLTAPATRVGIIIGALVATLFYTRAEYIVLIPALLVIALLSRAETRAVRAILLSVAVASALVLPWVVRNALVVPGFHPAGVGGGMTLWVRAVELQEADIAARNAWLTDPTFLAVHEGSSPAEMAAADARLAAEAQAIIRRHPIAYLSGAAGKLLFREWVEVYSPGLPRLVLLLATVVSSAIVAAAYLGVVSLSRLQSKLTAAMLILCFSMAAVHALGGTEARYTAPLRPVLYVFACAAMWTMIGGARRAALRCWQFVRDRS